MTDDSPIVYVITWDQMSLWIQVNPVWIHIFGLFEIYTASQYKQNSMTFVSVTIACTDSLRLFGLKAK